MQISQNRTGFAISSHHHQRDGANATFFYKRGVSFKKRWGTYDLAAFGDTKRFQLPLFISVTVISLVSA